MISNQQNRLRSRWLWATFLLVAGYVIVAGIFVQLVVAPRFADEGTPAGLIPGLDTVAFHEMAAEMAVEIDQSGWSAWEWDPGWSANQPVGIMAAVYAVFGVNPLYLLPINAVVHGISAVLLVLIFAACGFGARASFAGMLPFAFFPSTLTWVAQFHKDGIYALGFFLAVFGVVWILGVRGSSVSRPMLRKRVASRREADDRFGDSVSAVPLRSSVSRPMLRRSATGLLFLIGGGWIASTMRPYSVVLMSISFLGVAGLVVGWSWFSRQGRVGWKSDLLRLGILALGLVLLMPFAGSKGGQLESAAPAPTGSEVVVAERAVFTPGEDDTPPPSAWHRTSWLPASVDNGFLRLVHNRNIFLWMFPDGGSLVDEERPFHAVGDVVSYLPRAVVVGLFAPFPTEWLGQGASPTGGIQRKVAAVETLFAYSCLAALVVGLLVRPSRGRWFVALTGVLMILPLVYAVPAVGSLYRLRFAPFALLLGIGLAYAFHAFQVRQNLRDGSIGGDADDRRGSHGFQSQQNPEKLR